MTFKEKTVVTSLRLYESDKKEFQMVCSELRIKSDGKITEAMVFREMLNWLKKNKEMVERKFTVTRG